MPMPVETRLSCMRFLVHTRDYMDVVVRDLEHRLSYDAGEGVSCACGWEGSVYELEDPGTHEGNRCPVNILEHEEHESYLKACQQASGAVCVLCGVNWVDVMEGFDTCTTCQPRK